MVENSYLKRTPRSQQALFKKLEKGLSGIGLESFEVSLRKEEERALQLSPTKNKRQKDAEECISFRRYFGDAYFIEIFPTFNKDIGLFTKKGTVSFLVKRPSVKKGFKVCLGMYFHRKEGMVENLLVIAEFIAKVLQNQPRDKRDRLMQLKRIGEAEFAFVSKKNKNGISVLDSRFLENFDKGFQKKVLDIFNIRKKYHEKKDPNTKPIRSTKKKRKAKNPKSVVPVIS